MAVSQSSVSAVSGGIKIRQCEHNRAHRLRSRVLCPRQFDLIVKLMIDHYISGRPGEASRQVADRLGCAEDLVDGVVIAALLEARGDGAVYRHCQTLACQMTAERRQDTRQEFAEWFRRRAA